MIQLTKHFNLIEFIPKEILEKWGDKSIRFINPALPKIAQELRDFYQMPIKINDWYWNGQFNYSGFRPSDCPIGTKESAHKRGMAIDVKISDFSSKKIMEDILKNKERFMNVGLTVIEDALYTPTWVHLSCEWTQESDIVIVRPK